MQCFRFSSLILLANDAPTRNACDTDATCFSRLQGWESRLSHSVAMTTGVLLRLQLRLLPPGRRQC